MCLSGDAATPLLLEFKVSYEEMPPAHLVEYTFDEGAAEQSWRLAHVSLPYLLSYRAGKFADWEKRMLEPSCKAEFRRMFAIGPVFTVYDHHMFPSDAVDASQYEVLDESTGKMVVLPRPVAALRVW